MMVSNQLVFTGPSCGSVKVTKEASDNEQKSAAVAPDTSPLRQQPLFEGVKKWSGANGEGASASKQSLQIGEKAIIQGAPFDLKGTKLHFANG